MKRCVVCLAEYPEPGKVKKELSLDVWITDAAKVQEKFIKKILHENKKSFVYDFKLCMLWDDNFWQIQKQFQLEESEIFSAQWKNLAQIAKKVLEKMFQDYDEVILIGTDLPTLDQTFFKKVFNLLKKQDVVLGPTLDGKSYLVGMKNFDEKLFDQLSVTKKQNFEDIVNILEKNNCKYKALEAQRDMKSYKDLLKWAIHSRYYQKIISMIDGRILYRNFFV